MNKIIGCYIIFLMFPLLLGTTYIVRENGKEVGKWVENDGNDVTRYVDNIVARTESRTIAEPQKIASKRDEDSEKQQSIELEKYRERQEDFGIHEGLTREQVENISQEKGLRRKTKYTDNDLSTPDQKSYWIHEYIGETKHFKHFLKIYFLDWKVEKVFHNVEEK